MLILYTKNGCSYCEKVKHAFAEHHITYEERGISDIKHLEEAKEKGARTMPFLVDTSANIAMGESEEIIAYALEGTF
ncbi:MAG: Glutaredoxin protein [Patescibacteria group bacterium]|nr:Glutaredoxin protein [Patescibacteria group bacterium]